VPWNEVANKDILQSEIDSRPTLKAIILDFSSVSRTDLTSIQGLIDTRDVLDRYSAPRKVQWHFACIHSRWIKRALVSAKFGYPSFDAAEGVPQKWLSMFSVAETPHGDDRFVTDSGTGSMKKYGEGEGDVELTEVKGASDDEVAVIKHTAGVDSLHSAAIHGVNRPFFHVDIDTAVKSALALEQLDD
jgi:sodium-independent sulfate anion transporter 11